MSPHGMITDEELDSLRAHVQIVWPADDEASWKLVEYWHAAFPEHVSLSLSDCHVQLLIISKMIRAKYADNALLGFVYGSVSGACLSPHVMNHFLYYTSIGP